MIMTSSYHKILIAIKKNQDATAFKTLKKVKIKRIYKWNRFRWLLSAKYIKTRLNKKKTYGFWLNPKQHCKAYWTFSKLHRRIGFRQAVVKYKKRQKNALTQFSVKKWQSNFLCRSSLFNLMLHEPVIIEPRLVEIIRRTISRAIKKNKKLYKVDPKWWCNVHPNRPITRKGRGTRMGTGKGGVRTWICKVFIGKSLLSLKKNRIIQQPWTLSNKIKSTIPYKLGIIGPKSFWKPTPFVEKLCY